MEMDDNKRRRNMILYVLIAFVVYLVLSTVLFPNIGHTQQITKTDYSTFVKALDKKSVDKVEYNTDDYSIYYTKKGEDENIAYKTTGAANDIEQATKLARNMVTRFGMSDEFGMMALGTVQNAYLNQDTSLTCAPGTAERVDAIVAKLIEDAHDRALQILKENKFKLHELARYLYKKETITGEEFMNLLTRENPLMPKQQ